MSLLGQLDREFLAGLRDEVPPRLLKTDEGPHSHGAADLSNPLRHTA